MPFLGDTQTPLNMQQTILKHVSSSDAGAVSHFRCAKWVSAAKLKTLSEAAGRGVSVCMCVCGKKTWNFFMKLKQSKIKLLWLLAGWQKDYAMVDLCLTALLQPAPPTQPHFPHHFPPHFPPIAAPTCNKTCRHCILGRLPDRGTPSP